VLGEHGGALVKRQLGAGNHPDFIEPRGKVLSADEFRERADAEVRISPAIKVSLNT
jgi:hypothetical protein